MHKVCSSIIGFLYLNSDAISTSVGILQSFSNKFFPTKPACIAVPHATIKILFTLDRYSFVNSISSKEHFSPKLNLEPIVSLKMCIRDRGYTMSESTVGEVFDRLFQNNTKRIVVATFASNVHRVQPVSYTHLDVYKRQNIHIIQLMAGTRTFFILILCLDGFER